MTLAPMTQTVPGGWHIAGHKRIRQNDEREMWEDAYERYSDHGPLSFDPRSRRHLTVVRDR